MSRATSEQVQRDVDAGLIASFDLSKVPPKSHRWHRKRVSEPRYSPEEERDGMRKPAWVEVLWACECGQIGGTDNTHLTPREVWDTERGRAIVSRQMRRKTRLRYRWGVEIHS